MKHINHPGPDTSYIHYKKGYKYQLQKDYTIRLYLNLKENIYTDFIILNKYTENQMFLITKKGYAWDGPSGPTFDTKDFIRGSLIHDALYQLMRESYLDLSYRRYADLLLKDICIEDGMNILRAWLVYLGVRIGGGPSANPYNDRQIIQAPRRY